MASTSSRLPASRPCSAATASASSTASIRRANSAARAAARPRYAARFAAKEAVGKALGIGIIGFVWRDVEVLSGGKPVVALHGGVAEVAGRSGVARVELSLCHTGGVAYAVAAALTGADVEERRRSPGADDAKEAPHV